VGQVEFFQQWNANRILIPFKFPSDKGVEPECPLWPVETLLGLWWPEIIIFSYS